MNESTLVPREEMSDLDWLARNVHLWVPNELLRMKPCDNGNGTFRASWCYSGDGGFTKDQWLTRRAELQNKPSWNDMPDWAEWLAQDEDGEWKWLAGLPGKYVDGWTAVKIKGCCKGLALGDWRDTLEKRPDMYKNKKEIDTSSECVHKTEESVHISELEMQAKVSHLISDKRHRNQFEPFVSVEDAKISILQSDGDIKHFGGFIGRNLPFEEDSATTEQPAITPSKYTKTIHGVSVDVYDVLQAWSVSNPALQHLIKKALQCGQRGHKDNAQDLQDIIDSAIRAKELES